MMSYEKTYLGIDGGRDLDENYEDFWPLFHRLIQNFQLFVEKNVVKTVFKQREPFEKPKKRLHVELCGSFQMTHKP